MISSEVVSTSPSPIEIQDFKADWHTNDENQDMILLSWSLESHVTDVVEWKLLISNGSDEQTLRINFNCSRDSQKPNEHKVKIVPKPNARNFSPACRDDNQSLILSPCWSYYLKLAYIYGEELQNHSSSFSNSIYTTNQLKPIMKCWS